MEGAMSAVDLPERMRISVERYFKMADTGVLTAEDRVELIEGEILNMPPVGPPHGGITGRLTKLLVLAVGDSAVLLPGSTLPLGDYSAPQPDLLLLAPRADFYSRRYPLPSEVLLVVEISDSTLAFDRGLKRTVYAKHGIAEYWVVDVPLERLHRYLGPTRDGWYAQTKTFAAGDVVAPQGLPAVQVAVGSLFG
jgi:Uma2 family endonuclease